MLSDFFIEVIILQFEKNARCPGGIVENLSSSKVLAAPGRSRQLDGGDRIWIFMEYGFYITDGTAWQEKRKQIFPFI